MASAIKLAEIEKELDSSVPAPQKKRAFYRPELDLLRLMAFLMVFVHHTPRPVAFPWVGQVMGVGAYGVCLFFMLSAYLIAELLLRERAKTGSVHIRSFFARRVLRIWPLYFLAIGLGFLLGVFIPKLQIATGALPYLLLLAGNFYVAHFGWHLGTIDALWSLSVEEQFYLAIPTIAKWGGSRVLRNACFLCLPLAYIALAWLGFRHVTPHEGIWVNSFVQFQFFAAGTLVAIHFHARTWTIPNVSRLLLLAAGFAGLYVANTYCRLSSDSAVPTLPLCIGYLGVLMSCICIFLSFLNAPIRPPAVLLYLGKISFGLYIYHRFVLELVAHLVPWPSGLRAVRAPAFDLLSLLMTILVSTLSYELFERRILRFKERFAYVKSGSEAVAQ